MTTCTENTGIAEMAVNLRASAIAGAVLFEAGACGETNDTLRAGRRADSGYVRLGLMAQALDSDSHGLPQHERA